jgi:hypothetical protein
MRYFVLNSFANARNSALKAGRAGNLAQATKEIELYYQKYQHLILENMRAPDFEIEEVTMI